MRLIGAASTVFVVALALAASSSGPSVAAKSGQDLRSSMRAVSTMTPEEIDSGSASSATTPSATSSCGPMCCGCTTFSRPFAPATALAVGLKVDVEALPREIVTALKGGQVDLNDPAVTVELLRLNAVVGVRGRVNRAGQLASIGITCALCHSTVDDSFASGIGRRLDGWANTT